MIENVFQFSKTVQEVKKKEPDCRQIPRTICCRQAEMPNPRTMLPTTGTTKIRAKCAPNVHQNRPQQSPKNGDNITRAVARTTPATTIKSGADGPPGPCRCADGGFVPPTSSSEMNQTPPSAAHFNPLWTITYSRSIFPIQRPQSDHILTVRFTPSNVRRSPVFSRGSPDI